METPLTLNGSVHPGANAPTTKPPTLPSCPDDYISPLPPPSMPTISLTTPSLLTGTPGDNNDHLRRLLIHLDELETLVRTQGKTVLPDPPRDGNDPASSVHFRAQPRVFDFSDNPHPYSPTRDALPTRHPTGKTFSNKRHLPDDSDADMNPQMKEYYDQVKSILNPRSHANNSEDTEWNVFDSNPLSDKYRTALLPQNFRIPSFTMYTGTSDADRHLKHYTTKMLMHSANDFIMCKSFPGTLDESALDWFSSLPPRSINSFSQLGKLFLQNFAGSRI